TSLAGAPYPKERPACSQRGGDCTVRRMPRPRLGVLSVHYRLRRLLVDQHRRLCACAAPTRRALGRDLWYFPVVHHASRPDIVAAAAEMSSPRSPRSPLSGLPV